MNNPEMQASLNLLRYKMLMQIAGGKDTISYMDVNEVLLVGGMPVITPEEINAKELQIIRAEVKRQMDEMDPLDFD
jgi:hypothetical protein